MEWLNYHHLLYFWQVAREGSLAGACSQLNLAPSTVSKQIHELEGALGHALFARSGRRLVLSESGRIVLHYAEEIFGLGRELQDTLKDRPTGKQSRLSVGIVDVVPKLIVQQVLRRAVGEAGPVYLVCREDTPEHLLSELALHNLDVIITDAPVAANFKVKAFSHLLGEYGITFFGRPRLAEQAKKSFPMSLNESPILLPTGNTALRRSLDHWLEEAGIRPIVVGEFEDSALMMAFGQHGEGLFPAPSPIAREVARQYRVVPVGEVPLVRERLYAVSVERELENPAAVAVCDTAQDFLRRDTSPATAGGANKTRGRKRPSAGAARPGRARVGRRS